MKDSFGFTVSGATNEGLVHLEQAFAELRCFVGDPVESVDRALRASPEMAMAHALKAWLHPLGTEPSGLVVANDCL